MLLMIDAEQKLSNGAQDLHGCFRGAFCALMSAFIWATVAKMGFLPGPFGNPDFDFKLWFGGGGI